MPFDDIPPTDPFSLPDIIKYAQSHPSSTLVKTSKADYAIDKHANHYPIRSTFAFYLFLLILIPISCISLKYSFQKFTPNLSQSSTYSQASRINHRVLATMDNTQSGYTFQYPSDFSVINDDNGISLIPPNDKGKIIISVKNQLPEIDTADSGLTPNELADLKNTAEVIKSSFVITRPLSYSDEQLKQRFEDSKNLPVN